MIKKTMTLVGVALLLASTILSPVSAVAQTWADQASKTQSVTQNRMKQRSDEQEAMPSSTKETTTTSSQTTKEETSSKTTSKVEEKSETQPGALPRSKRTRRAAPAGALDVKQVDDVITEIHITDGDGKPIPQKGVEMWQSFRVYAKFQLNNNTVNEGDITIIKLPDSLRFPDEIEFDVKDSKGNVVARAKINATAKTVTLKYTKYPSEHSDVSGELFFYVAVDHNKIRTKTDLELKFTVGNKVITGGNLHYQGPGQKTETEIDKSAWQDGTDKSLLHYMLAVNRKGANLTDISIQDRLKNVYGVQIVPSSIQIVETEWYWDNGEWKHRNDRDVTQQHTVKMDADGHGFQVKIGNIGKKGYFITYKVRTDYVPVDGETFENGAKLFDKGKLLQERLSWLVYRAAGGKAEGYVYSIKIHKKDENSKNLQGAEFELTRDSTGEVKKVTTDANGNAEIKGLLKDNYTLRETKAPNGYKLSNEEIKIKPSDFGTDKVYKKEVINKKDEKISAQLQVKKELIGRQLKDKEFTFELKRKSDKHLEETVQNDGAGLVKFKELTFTEVGTYEYIISEKREDHPEKGINYDPNDIYATVTVSRDASGKLVSTVKYEGLAAQGGREEKNKFTNHYIPDKTSTKLSVTKKLIGRDLQNGEFEFELKDLQNNNKVLETVKNKADGKVEFKEIEYTKAGTYNYTITEKSGNVAGVEYDPNLISVTVKVEDQGGQLKVTKVMYSKVNEEVENPTFINRYTPGKTFARLEVNKILTGRQLQKDEFEFELKNDDTGVVEDTAKNNTDGKVTFKELEYKEAGNYHYTITEKKGQLGGITYDTKEVKATVKITDDGKGKLHSEISYEKNDT
ncbi:FctA domain-containing protein, partial [Streptococcus intermedius]|uniref:Spy0128 family protein n=1 Tax=Streptococcus intermedius TaxID=1338 RepID=UPI002553D322